MKGNKFLILTGAGGTKEGYEGKYERMARNAANRGFETSVVPTPIDIWQRAEVEIDDMFARECDGYQNVYAFGASAGANLILWKASKFKEIQRALCVNPVMSVNFHRSTNAFENFKGRLVVVFGEYDSSAKWAKLIPQKENLTTVTIAGASHQFSGMTEEFIALPEQYLF